jgi:hypothetical protein
LQFAAKWKIILFLNRLRYRKKFEPTDKKNFFFSTQKIVTKLSQIWVEDPGTGKPLSWIPDAGFTKATDPGSGSATLRTRERL